jgi:hypothetical protein
VQISVVDAYSGMELCRPIWLNHDHRDGGVVDISVVDARQDFYVKLAINVGGKSFSKKIQN